MNPNTVTSTMQPGDPRVAQTILMQLGGMRFAIMTGAKCFSFAGDSLSFLLPKAKDGIRVVRVTLNAADTYDVDYMKGVLAKGNRLVKRDEGIYADQLQACFTAATGLYTSL